MLPRVRYRLKQTRERCSSLKIVVIIIIRSIFSINLLEKIFITKIHKMDYIKYKIRIIIRKGRLAWFGYVCRLLNSSLGKRSLKKYFKPKREKGRPEKRRIDKIKRRFASIHHHYKKVHERLHQMEKACEYNVGNNSTRCAAKQK